jgi:hypothetical protein
MIQHRGAELGCRYDLSTQTSLLSPAYLLSVVHWTIIKLFSGSLLPAIKNKGGTYHQNKAVRTTFILAAVVFKKEIPLLILKFRITPAWIVVLTVKPNYPVWLLISLC